jgi:DNA modification methylase
MIGMWDEIFSDMNCKIQNALNSQAGNEAFEGMHRELDKVWAEIARLAKNGAFVCINIGDAARTIGGEFQLYPNHARIISAFVKLGLTTLPLILWRKQTNAPNKFMGSGMLPAGAYVTLEHEYILIFRKGGKRLFITADEKQRRAESAFFWEERNTWFSDLWDFKGTRQKLNLAKSRQRSAAFPFELAWRLINMYSIRGDTVLDPFAGTGTTLHAAAAAGRNSVGVEIDKNFGNVIFKDLKNLTNELNKIAAGRIDAHCKFMEAHTARGGSAKYFNNPHKFPVVTRQEIHIHLEKIEAGERDAAGKVKLSYRPLGEEEGRSPV